MDLQRFVLTDAEISEAFAAAGCIPLEGDFPEGLPAASGVLPEVLAGDRAELDPALRQMIETFSHPDISVRIATAKGGEGSVLDDCVLRIGGDRCVALARSGPGQWLIESLGGRAGAVARIEELVKQPGGAPLELRWLADGTAVAGRFCGRCGTLFDDSPAFCRECGEPLSARP